MPELPEVETMKNSLQILIGETVTNLTISNKKLRKNIELTDLNSLINYQLLNIFRKGKFLFLHFQSDSQNNTLNNTLVMHAGMSGNFFIFNKKDYIPKKHDHIIFTFSNEKVVAYNDPRRFGLSTLYKNHPPMETEIYKNLGIDALSKDLNGDILFSLCKNRNQSIKSALLNQKIIAGVGNIYALESLFLSNISPLKPCKEITQIQYQTLHKNILLVLSNSIKLGGSTLKDYKKTDGTIGNFQTSFKVYGRHKQQCFVCQNPIIKIIQNQRSSFYCNICQT